MSQVSLEKLLEIMEAKDTRLVDELGGVQAIAQNIGSDVEKGLLSISDHDLDQRKQKYGVNKMERKAPPSIFELFMEAMKDTTIIVLLIAAVISITIGAVICSIQLGKTCPRKPLWDIGYTPGKEVCDLTMKNSMSRIERRIPHVFMSCRSPRKVPAWNGRKVLLSSWPA